MRCVYCAAVGGNDPLANLAIGELSTVEAHAVPKGGDAIVKVAAASLNHHDLWTLKGVASRPLKPPQVLGCDAAGTVEAYSGEMPPGALPLGSRVVVHSVLGCAACPACLVGDPLHCAKLAILSEPGYPGALAERLIVPAANLVALPDSVGFETAACLPTAYLTAYHALFDRARLQPGTTLLVHGASGGVATAAMLLGAAAGISVLVTSREPSRATAAVESGIAAQGFGQDRAASAAILAATGGRGVDAVLDTVGEPVWELSLRSVRPGGTVVVVGATGGPNPPAQLNRIFWRHITIAGSSMGTRSELEALVHMCADQRLAPLIDSVRGFDEARSAFSQLVAGTGVGKLVLVP